jgi:hypothetical protein
MKKTMTRNSDAVSLREAGGVCEKIAGNESNVFFKITTCILPWKKCSRKNRATSETLKKTAHKTNASLVVSLLI